jgi:lysozyme
MEINITSQMGKLVEQLKRHEGFKSKAYKCLSDRLTIGYGRNIEDRGITKEEAEYLLMNDIRECTADLEFYLPFWLTLDNARKDILINMCFNLGMTRLAMFKRFLKAVEEGDFDKAAKEMLNSKWAKQVGNRAIELAAQMKTGKYRDEL